MTQTPPEPPPPWSSVALSADAMKVLAHPLRSRLLAALRIGGPATATALAEELDTNTGATSYHLRRLAAVGLVEETGAGRGRERWWRATTQMHSWTDEAAEGDPDTQAAARWLREAGFRMFVDAAQEWLHNHDAWPIEWRRIAGASDYTIQLTVDELAAMQQELTAVVRRYAEKAAEAKANRPVGVDPDADGPGDQADDGVLARPQPVFLYLNAFPKGPGPR
jgi:predicted ArsR family transcriptional regulator